MSSSDVIKVDTEQLRTLAKGYVVRSGVVNDTWNSTKLTLDGIVRRMPAYDGRLQKAVNEDVLDFSIRSRDFFTFFQDDSASLIKIAEAFEVVDGQTIQILENADTGITRASLIDSGIDLGLSTKITKTTIQNPDGSISTITCVRIINPDGSVTTTTTITTVLVLDAKTADYWNKLEKAGMAVLLFTGFSFLGVEIAVLAKTLELSLAAAQSLAIGLRAINTSISVGSIFYPSRGWKEGDTITTTTIITSTEPLETPDTPIPETSPLGPDITSTRTVTDSTGAVLSTDTTRVDPTGAVKSGTPPIS